MFTLQHIDHIAFTVKDLEVSARWYQDVLGLERHQPSSEPYPIDMISGNTAIALFPAKADQQVTRPTWHVAFRADRANYDRAQVVLKERGIPFDIQDHGYSVSLYLTDPDGHVVEITTYEV
ncbi:MAG: VOC family protein [Acidobacteria bacterium]|nr:VOC family protein [Acidobacteriota bacterium]